MRIFLLQRWSAVALLVFLTIHMIVVHYPPFHIDFSRIVERMADPLWKLIDIGFLAAVLVHALTGAYMVITDVERFGKFKRTLAGVAIVVGMWAMYYGTITIMSFAPPV